MNDTTSNNAISMEARVTKVGEAISEGVQSATAATAAVAGHAQKIVQMLLQLQPPRPVRRPKYWAMRVKRRSALGPKQAPRRKMF
jgi:hypothetical protein